MSFVVQREKEVQVGMSRSCRRCFQVTAQEGCQEGAPKREVEKKRRKMRTAKGKVKYAIAQEVVAGIKEKAGVREDAKSTAQRTVGQSVKQSWDCSHIENEEEEEEDNWQQEDQMEAQRAEDEKWEEILERRRMEGSSVQAEVMQEVLELVVQERMSKGKGVKCTKERRK